MPVSAMAFGRVRAGRGLPGNFVDGACRGAGQAERYGSRGDGLACYPVQEVDGDSVRAGRGRAAQEEVEFLGGAGFDDVRNS